MGFQDPGLTMHAGEVNSDGIKVRNPDSILLAAACCRLLPLVKWHHTFSLTSQELSERIKLVKGLQIFGFLGRVERLPRIIGPLLTVIL